MLTPLLQRNKFRQIVFFAFLFLISTSFAFAADVTPEYKPLVGIPGLPKLSEKTSLPDYINQVYLLVIVIGALLGVMRLAWAGVKYSLSDVVTEKSEAKHDMTGVLMGLAILLIPFVVLKEINPDLIRLDVFHEARNFKISSPTSDFACNTTDCQNKCRDIQRGTIKERNGEKYCSYAKSNIFRPVKALGPTETTTYMECLRKGGDFNYDSRGCDDSSPTWLEGKCKMGGGTFIPGSCTPRKVIAVETYEKGVLDEFKKKNYDFETSWEEQCGNSPVEAIEDHGLVTYACYKN